LVNDRAQVLANLVRGFRHAVAEHDRRAAVDVTHDPCGEAVAEQLQQTTENVSAIRGMPAVALLPARIRAVRTLTPVMIAGG
jgi:hypothetical protein